MNKKERIKGDSRIMTIDEVIHQCRQLMYSNDKRILGDEMIVLLRLAYQEGQQAGTNHV